MSEMAAGMGGAAVAPAAIAVAEKGGMAGAAGDSLERRRAAEEEREYEPMRPKDEERRTA